MNQARATYTLGHTRESEQGKATSLTESSSCTPTAPAAARSASIGADQTVRESSEHRPKNQTSCRRLHTTHEHQDSVSDRS